MSKASAKAKAKPKSQQKRRLKKRQVLLWAGVLALAVAIFATRTVRSGPVPVLPIPTSAVLLLNTPTVARATPSATHFASPVATRTPLVPSTTPTLAPTNTPHQMPPPTSPPTSPPTFLPTTAPSSIPTSQLAATSSSVPARTATHVTAPATSPATQPPLSTPLTTAQGTHGTNPAATIASRGPNVTASAAGGVAAPGSKVGGQAGQPVQVVAGPGSSSGPDSGPGTGGGRGSQGNAPDLPAPPAPPAPHISPTATRTLTPVLASATPTATATPGYTATAPLPTPTASPAHDRELARVVRVIDGDTLVVMLKGAEVEEHVQLIGVDSPDVSKGKLCYAQEAKQHVEELIRASDGRVYIEKDVSDADHFGRLLRYVWLPGQDEPVMLNLVMVKGGYARAAAYPPDVKHRHTFEEAERQAQEQKLGLWGGCPSFGSPLTTTPAPSVTPGATDTPGDGSAPVPTESPEPGSGVHSWI